MTRIPAILLLASAALLPLRLPPLIDRELLFAIRR